MGCFDYILPKIHIIGDDMQKSEESMGPPCPPEPARLGRTTSKEGGTLKCGKCKACKFKCEECTSCLTEPKKPGGPQKGCEKREICLTPKRRSPSKTPNRSVSKKREGGDLEDPNAKVKKKIEDQAALTESSMVGTGGTGECWFFLQQF